MGHRALVAYEQPDGRYQVHYSHWGAADLRLYSLLRRGAEPGEAGIDAEIWIDGVTLRELAHDHLDYLTYEALYVVSLAGEVRAFETFSWERCAPDDVDVSRQDGALYEPQFYEGDPVSNLTGRFRGYCARLLEEQERDMIDHATAAVDLEQWLNTQVRPSSSDDIPAYSPRAHLPPGVDGSLSRLIADAEERHR